MSTTEPVHMLTEPWDRVDMGPVLSRAPISSSSIVPKSSIAGRSLAAIVAIMTFLAALTTGAVLTVVSAATDWQASVGREVTIQVRPAPGRDTDDDVRRAAAIARAIPGIADVHPYTKAESAQLVEPWLGAGPVLDDLPIPRLIIVHLAPGARPDLEGLRKTLAAQVFGATLDDHRRWIERMRTVAGTAAATGLAVFALVLAVTVLAVTFATGGAMATNRPIIEVLHYVGATDAFIGRQFQRHFLVLGLRGGAIGGGAAILLFGMMEATNAWLASTPGGDEIAALFGRLSIGIIGYVSILAQIGLMAVVTALASRQTVRRTLAGMD